MRKILLVGGGGHCISAIDVIEQSSEFEVGGIIDKFLPLNTKILGYSVIGKDHDLNLLLKKFKYAIVTVGQIKSSSLRVELFNKLKETGFSLPKIISSKAYVSRHSKIGEGTIVMHDVLVNANSSIGKNCIINSKALIEHDCLINDNCHISTSAIINGGTTIGSNCFIGSNVTTKNNIIIKDSSFIKAGSVIK